jgi:hypothetical protein
MRGRCRPRRTQPRLGYIDMSRRRRAGFGCTHFRSFHSSFHRATYRRTWRRTGWFRRRKRTCTVPEDRAALRDTRCCMRRNWPGRLGRAHTGYCIWSYRQRTRSRTRTDNRPGSHHSCYRSRRSCWDRARCRHTRSRTESFHHHKRRSRPLGSRPRPRRSSARRPHNSQGRSEYRRRRRRTLWSRPRSRAHTFLGCRPPPPRRRPRSRRSWRDQF